MEVRAHKDGEEYDGVLEVKWKLGTFSATSESTEEETGLRKAQALSR